MTAWMRPEKQAQMPALCTSRCSRNHETHEMLKSHRQSQVAIKSLDFSNQKFQNDYGFVPFRCFGDAPNDQNIIGIWRSCAKLQGSWLAPQTRLAQSLVLADTRNSQNSFKVAFFADPKSLKFESAFPRLLKRQPKYSNTEQ